MIKNYFFLSRLSYELKELINGSIILDSYTYQKDKLEISLLNHRNFVLEFCVNHTLPFIQIVESLNRKKKNSKIIFPQIINLKFSDIFIAKNDRVILFQIENKISLFFTIRGKFTNLYLLNETDFISFKKITEENLDRIKEEFLSLEFIAPLTIPEFTIEDLKLSFNELKLKYPFLSSDMLTENTKEDFVPIELLYQEIKKIYHNEFYLINNLKRGELKILTTINNKINAEQYDKFSSAIEVTKNYVSLYQYNQQFKNLFSHISKHIEKELNYSKKKKENMLIRIKEGSKESYYRKIAELLLINKSKLVAGLNEITVNDIYCNNSLITILLNNKLNPQQNIEYYFEKAKDEKLFFERVQKILPDLENKILLLENAKHQLDFCESLNSLQSIMKLIGLKMKIKSDKQEEPKPKFKQYIIENKFNVYVGRDNKSNDLLTLKFAKQNDYWFHARAVSGSHVVLRNDNKNEAVPKSILKKAASIAAFHSKAKNSSLVPVSYTLKKYVVKKKGMDFGQVVLLKEQTLLVKPEIPEDAILVQQSSD